MNTVRRTATALTATLLGALLLAGCGPDAGASNEGGFVSGTGLITMVPVEDREQPVEIEGETLEGEPIALADFAGKIVVVNVWGSWCPPCRAEAPDLVAAANELEDKGVVFLGIDTRDPNRAAPLAFQRTFDVPYPSIYDPSGKVLLGFRGTVPPNAIPSTLIIDEQGRVAAGKLDQITKSTLLGLVEEVAQSSAGSAAGRAAPPRDGVS